jgi:predicted metal-binding transcription factor (methanogenesis marker protein 9)
MCKLICGSLAVALFLLAPAWAQDNSANQQPVSRQEFEELKKENAEMKQELTEIRQEQAEQAAKLAQETGASTRPADVQQQQTGSATSQETTEIKQELADIKKTQAEQASNADQDAQDYDNQLKALQQQVKKSSPGLEDFVIVGDANIGYSAQRGNDSTFFADVSPLILWQPPDSHFLIETAFDLQIPDGGINSQGQENTTASLELGDISYDVCDYLTVGGGLFTVPFGQFHNHFDPPWINKFPDDPLAFDAIAPVSEVGFFAKGAIPSGTTKWTYDVYVSNGPNLATDETTGLNPGQLNFNDYTDLNNNKAVGGRIGFLPFPDMEMGYSAQFSKPNPDGFASVHAFMQAADFHYKPTVDALDGQFDLSAEWIWSELSTATYGNADPTMGPVFGPVTYNDNSKGGYVSLTYRPTELDDQFLKNLEFVSRYDTLQTPLNTIGGDHESRYSVGVDYWITPYCVVKTVYEIDQKKVGQDQNAFIVQLGIGL